MRNVYRIKCEQYHYSSVYVAKESLVFSIKKVSDWDQLPSLPPKWDVHYHEIFMDDITLLRYSEQSGRSLLIKLGYTKIKLRFPEKADRKVVVDLILGHRGFTFIDKKPNYYNAVEWPLLVSIVLYPFLYLLYMKARLFEKGKLSLISSGGHATPNQMNELAAWLGVQNVLILGGVLLVFLLFICMRRIQRPLYDNVHTFPLLRDLVLGTRPRR